jgi:hypothetical protein
LKLDRDALPVSSAATLSPPKSYSLRAVPILPLGW